MDLIEISKVSQAFRSRAPESWASSSQCRTSLKNPVKTVRAVRPTTQCSCSNGINLCDDAPDAKSIWHYREMLTEKGVIGKLFDQFNTMLEEQGLIAEQGVILDVNFKEVPGQPNSSDENKKIKKGESVEGWSENKHRQKDTGAMKIMLLPPVQTHALEDILCLTMAVARHSFPGM